MAPQVLLATGGVRSRDDHPSSLKTKAQRSRASAGGGRGQLHLHPSSRERIARREPAHSAGTGDEGPSPALAPPQRRSVDDPPSPVPADPDHRANRGFRIAPRCPFGHEIDPEGGFDRGRGDRDSSGPFTRHAGVPEQSQQAKNGKRRAPQHHGGDGHLLERPQETTAPNPPHDAGEGLRGIHSAFHPLHLPADLPVQIRHRSLQLDRPGQGQPRATPSPGAARPWPLLS